MAQRGRPTKEQQELNAEQAAHAEQTAALQKQILAAQRMLRLRAARDSLLDFTTMSMPHPEDPDDAARSRYDPQLHHRIIAEALQEVEKGSILRLIITMPPRAGKSELVSKRFPAWFTGRDPYRHTIVAGYSDTFVEEFGREVREIMTSPFYQQVFPGTRLRRGSKAADRLQTSEGGILTFAGVGGGLTGKGADLAIIDDPIKNSDDANSPTMRDKQWEWFTRVLMTRLMTAAGRVIICMTRWHPDDLVGRLTDPKSDYYNPNVAKQFKILHIPALAEPDDVLRREVGASLWPDRFPTEFLLQMRELDPRGFNALYQGRPTPPDGDFFKRQWIDDHKYNPHELPKNLRVYIASDHAVSTDQQRDATCLLAAGVDEQGVTWILPHAWWRREQTDVVVEGMLEMMRYHKPLIWWAERGHISKSIGPFLRKRMQEEHTFVSLEEVVPVKDKLTRAQAIQGRAASGMVRWPTFAPWWAEAEAEILKFPGGTHDDFVDALAHLGMGLARQVRADKPAGPAVAQPRSGTFGWIKAAAKYYETQQRLANRGGF